MITLENYWWPLLLSTVAGLSTSIGALLAVTRTPDEAMLAFLLGTAVGVMATVSCVEMWWHKALQHSNWLGVTAAVMAGAVVFALLDPLLPKPLEAQLLPYHEQDNDDGVVDAILMKAEPHAVLSVGPEPHIRHSNGGKQERSSANQQLVSMTSGADMCNSPRHPADLPAADNSATNKVLYHSPTQNDAVRLRSDSVTNFTPAVATRPDSSPGHVQECTSRMTGTTISNRRYTEKQCSTGSGQVSATCNPESSRALLELRAHHSGLLRLGVLMAVTMTLHNLPEGFAVAFSAFTGFGKLMALAIAVHNIPEGLVIAVPVYAATNSKFKAIGLAAASGLSEPCGALIALFIFKPFVSSLEQLDYVLAFVAGVMLAVCWLELWPEGRKCRQDRRLAQGILLGSVVMSWTLSVGA